MRPQPGRGVESHQGARDAIDGIEPRRHGQDYCGSLRNDTFRARRTTPVLGSLANGISSHTGSFGVGSSSCIRLMRPQWLTTATRSTSAGNLAMMPLSRSSRATSPATVHHPGSAIRDTLACTPSLSAVEDETRTMRALCANLVCVVAGSVCECGRCDMPGCCGTRNRSAIQKPSQDSKTIAGTFVLDSRGIKGTRGQFGRT